MHTIFLDESLNGKATVIHNIFNIFCLCSIKFFAFVHQALKTTNTKFLCRSIRKIIEYGFITYNRRLNIWRTKDRSVKFTLTKAQIEFIGFRAFRKVLCSRKSKFLGVANYVDSVIESECTDTAMIMISKHLKLK